MKIKIFDYKNKALLFELVRTDFKLRYENSVLGYLWSVLNPLLLFGVLYVVFALFLGVGRNIEHFPVYLLTGIVLWRFFTEATNNGMRAIVRRGGLIRKINFPKYIIVLSGTISSLINLVINLGVVALFMLINGVPVTWYVVFIIPLVLELYVLALGVALFLSALNVFLRDISNIWEVVLQAAFYAIPIIYPVSLIFDKSFNAGILLMVNPVAQVIQDARYVLVTQDDSVILWNQPVYFMVKIIPILIVFACIALGSFYFRSKSSSFAEHV